MYLKRLLYSKLFSSFSSNINAFRNINLYRYTPFLFFLVYGLGGMILPRVWKSIYAYLYPPLPPVDKVKQEYDTQKEKFLSFCKECPDKNKAIDPLFYNKKQLQEFFRDKDNTLEPFWKKKILLQNTVRGNILMTYDPYKLGFSYYCDNKTLAYTILNTMALKYTRMFACADFFMDNEVIETHSPIWDIHLNEKKKKEEQDDDTEGQTDESKKAEANNKKELKNALKDAPFLRSKKNNAESKTKTAPNTLSKKEKEEWDKKEAEKEELRKQEASRIRNKFIYLGKISHFPFLQTPKKQTLTSSFKSAFTSLLDGEHDLQNNRFDYKQFKAQQVQQNKPLQQT